MSKEQGIIFQGWGVNAIRNLRRGTWPPEAIDPSKPIKWQTRRVVQLRKNWPGITHDDLELSGFWVSHCLNCPKCQGLPEGEYCGEKNWQYGDEFLPQQYHAGRGLWVRETHYRFGRWVKDGITKTGRDRWRFKPAKGEHVRYTDNPPARLGHNRGVRRNEWWKRPSIFMPRWASREDLLLKKVDVERVQEITGKDCLAEAVGSKSLFESAIRHEFKLIWNAINDARGFGWEANPWVWVVSYMRT